MAKYVDERPEYSKAVGQLIVEYDEQAFTGARHIVASVLCLYYTLYRFIINNWLKLGRPVRSQPSSLMHG